MPKAIKNSAPESVAAEPAASQPVAAEPAATRARAVEVICATALGPLLLRRGDVTDDPRYVALLDTKRGRELVREL